MGEWSFKGQNSIYVVADLIRCYLGRASKKRMFYGQADRKCLPPTPPPLRSAFYEFFWCVYLSYIDYDSMCSETDFTQEKSHFHPTSSIPNFPYCLLLLVTKIVEKRYSNIKLPTSELPTGFQSWGWRFWVYPILRIANPAYNSVSSLSDNIKVQAVLKHLK